MMVEQIDGRPLGDAPDSKSTLAVVKDWLGTCQMQHPQCNALISGGRVDENEPIMPAYVVDVGEDGQRPKLLKTKPGIQGPYAALSHVWGNGNFTTQTIKNNVVQFQKSIDLASKESKTLMDAVAITRSLGLPYLWVDSLCIVQDGPGFDAQCDLMGQIYENATVTIAAAGAPNDHIGCFIPRPKPRLPPVHLITKWGAGQKASHVYISVQTGRLPNAVDRGIWAARGWVLQERILSRRIVYFAGDQVYWECLAKTNSEDGTSLNSGNPMRLTYGALDTQLENKEAEAMRTYSRWSDLQAVYTQRILSRPEDMLCALAGVKQEIIRKTGGTFLAGHWSDYLQIGLLWQAKYARLAIPEKPQAPSWSWASRIGPTFHDPYLYSAQPDEGYSIASPDVHAQKEDVHGKTYFGSLTLNGRMKPVVKMEGGLSEDENGEGGLWGDVSTKIHRYSQDLSLLSALTDPEEAGTLIGWGSFDQVNLTHVDTDTRSAMALCVSNNLPPAREGSPVTETPELATVTYNVLLLKREDEYDSKNLNYVRIGMGEIISDLWFDDAEPSTVTLV